MREGDAARARRTLAHCRPAGPAQRRGRDRRRAGGGHRQDDAAVIVSRDFAGIIGDVDRRRRRPDPPPPLWNPYRPDGAPIRVSRDVDRGRIRRAADTEKT